MSGKIKLFLLFFASLLTMCTNSPAEPVTYSNGLSCVPVGEEEVNCTYTCPDGAVKEITLSLSMSSLESSSKEEMDAALCNGPAQPTATPMESILTVFPVSSATRTPAASRTAMGSPPSGTQAALGGTATPLVPVAGGSSLLTGSVPMCDLGGKLINFRIVQPPPDITGRTLEVQIGDRESFCYVNPTNRSLLTCTIPEGVSFPANITVSLDGTVVDEFVYNGLGCAILTTQTPAPRTPRPTSYP